VKAPTEQEIAAEYQAKFALSRTSTRRIRPSDLGVRATDLDLALTFEPTTRTYRRR
jgi:hypothetical protein